MSYVLDALKKADAERERGAVPGLHTQPMAVLPQQGAAASRVPPWAWMALGVVVALPVAWVAWRAGQPDAPVAEVPAAVQAPPPLVNAAPAVAAPPVSVQAPMPVPAPGSVTTAAAPAAPAAALPPPVTSMPPAMQAPAAAPVKPSKPSPSPQVAAMTPAEAAAPKPTDAGKRRTADAATTTAAAPAVPAATPDAGGEGRILALNEMPENLKRELPALTVGGSIYSDAPASRFVIINGQIFHENDKLGPELTLEQIKLKMAVLRYKGVRFRISY